MGKGGGGEDVLGTKQRGIRRFFGKGRGFDTGDGRVEKGVLLEKGGRNQSRC